jgi:hypothetical protein
MRIAVATLLFLTFTASGQTFDQTTYLRTHEQPMSARAAAMGGASDALSNDVSDLAANPALIASLKKTTFSFSGAQTGYAVTRYDPAHFDPETFDSRFRADKTTRSLAHASVAMPLRNFVLGAYYRDEPRLRGDHELSPQAGSDPYVSACLYPPCSFAIGSDAVAFDRRDRRYGVTAAFERGALSLGAGIELRDFSEQHNVESLPIPNGTGMELVTRRISGQAYVPSAGLRWRVSPRVAVAAAYNGGGTFERADDMCRFDLVSATCTSGYASAPRSNVKSADAYRASISIAPVERLIVTAEAVRTNYTRMENEGEHYSLVLVDLPYRDATDLHAGAEYRLRNLPLSVRVGWWREEAKRDHDWIELEGSVDHRTVGVGLDVGAARLDLAYDDAEATALRRAMIGVTFTR